MKNNALKISDKDNVAVATQPLKKDELVVIDGKSLFKTVEDIDIGHKIALTAISADGKVIRYGEPIVKAIRDIRQGEWVHVHNTKPFINNSVIRKDSNGIYGF